MFEKVTAGDLVSVGQQSAVCCDSICKNTCFRSQSIVDVFIFSAYKTELYVQLARYKAALRRR